MPKFDPHKPPMTLDESERLLRAADQAKYSRADVGQYLLMGGLLLLLVAIGVGLWFLSHVIGTGPAALIGVVAVIFWLSRRE